MNNNTYGVRDWSNRSAVAATFERRESAENAIKELKDRNFDGDSIGVAMRDRDEEGRLREETGNHAGEGAVTGAVSGGVLGGIVGLLVGMGALAIPGIGPVIAGGALATTFGVAGGTAVAGAGIGAVAGGLVGALIGLGIPKHEAEYLDTRFREGHALVTVSAPGRTEEAARILEAHGGDTGGHLYEGSGAQSRSGGQAYPG
jgi:outer membrane lipoprotein SlyB